MSKTSIFKLFLLTLCTVTSYKLNTSKYQYCVFHVLFNTGLDPGSETKNIAESVLTSNQGNQHWIVGQMETSNQSNVDSYVTRTDPVYFNETCSVGIVIHNKNCSEAYLLNIFGSRLLNPQSIFILFDQHCKEQLTPSKLYTGANIYFVHVSQKTAEVTSVRSFCASCSWMYKVVRYTLQQQ